MSKIINDKDARPGCIYRIALKNFVTYTDVELFPGLFLNLILGPNGTGKSTFVCAIILGLCGKPSVIGRAKNISAYVRTGCDEATIEIELYQQPGQRNIVITRNFNKDDISKWYIDGKAVRENKVQEIVSSLNIQVDNFCQLLPQDRVHDFSKMNPQQLLRSTLSAVGGRESVELLDELIQCRTHQKGMSTRLQNNTQRIEEYEMLNQALKVRIDAMQQRKEIEQQIEMCEKKKLWLEYDVLREKVVECQNDKKQATHIVSTHKNKLEPLENEIRDAKNAITQTEKLKLAAARECHIQKEKIKEIIDSVKNLEYKIKEVQDSFLDKLERYENREREIAQAKAKVGKLKTDMERVVTEVGDADSVNSKLAKLKEPIKKTNAAIAATNRKKLDIQYSMENQITPEIRQRQNKLRQLQNVGEKRLRTLREYSADAFKAVQWLRANRDMFQDAVYEPMMLEIHFTEAKFARYLESTISNRDLTAFTFTSTRDMNLFLRKVRLELGMKQVNAICSQGEGRHQPTGGIDQLSYLGFYTYLVDTLTDSTPDAIVRYLCRQYNIHKIPIGNDHTYNNSGSVPPHIRMYFTENHRFSVRVSAYSGATSSSTNEITPPVLLANTVDSEQINTLQTQLSDLEQQLASHEAQMRKHDEDLAKLNQHLEKFNNDRKKIEDAVYKVRTIMAQIALEEKNVQDLENEPVVDIDKEKEICRQKKQVILLKQVARQREVFDASQKRQENQRKGVLWKAKLDFHRDSIVQQESQIFEYKSEMHKAQTTLDNIEGILNRAKSEAKQKLVEAKRATQGKVPGKPDFPYKSDFDQLSTDLEEIRERVAELTTRLRCMDPGDEHMVKAYEERQRTIEFLRAETSSFSDQSRDAARKIEHLKGEWLPPVEELLRTIDRGFGDMFARMDCAGEIKLDKAAGDDDFDKYGISIMVRFRSGQNLEQLNRHMQSGGERAISTALYLLALQQIATVPFRCVDEINQGMDNVNERKMFQLLVKATTDRDNAQYFLLTPKLLTNLEYNEKIMVHTIYNGINILNCKKWNYESFLERAKNYNVPD